MRQFRISELEKANGLELSHPELDLPTIRVVRNPGGFDWEPWIAQGFPWQDTDGRCPLAGFMRQEGA